MTTFFAIIWLVFYFWIEFQLSIKKAIWSSEGCKSGVTGVQAVSAIMEQTGVHNVGVLTVKGKMSNRYDPDLKWLFLNGETSEGTSPAALAAAAHETEHAVQCKEAYTPMLWGKVLADLAKHSCRFMPAMVFGGYFLNCFGLIRLATVLCLPCGLYFLAKVLMEFDADRRAKKALLQLSIVNKEEYAGVCEIFNCKALSYVNVCVFSLCWIIWCLNLFIGTNEIELYYLTFLIAVTMKLEDNPLLP